uniref:VWFC domain-containing protein n=1 Tax=Apis cerana TaxID=7461 RepID=V9III8_APICE
MATRHAESRSFVQKCVFLAFLFAIQVAGGEICDKTKCAGVLKYYEGLGCTPVYKNPNDCCAESYNCTHLDNLSRDKCYVNGHEYSDGETLRPEHANPCDIGCKCILFNNEASFVCAGFDCAFISGGENCFHRSTHDSCCPSTVPTCLKEGEKRATCEVDGKVYLDGEYFSPKSDPNLDCYCMPGYTGENIEPFCKKINHPHCSPLFTNGGSIYQKCAPVFYDNQNPQTDCSYVTRCQNSEDVVIHNHDHTKSISDEEDKVCKFGNMTMHIGDELDKGTNYDSLCVKCVCEVPPIPTCRRLPDSECDINYAYPSIKLL